MPKRHKIEILIWKGSGGHITHPDFIRRTLCVCVCVCVVGTGKIRRSLPEEIVVGLRYAGCTGVHCSKRSEKYIHGKGKKAKVMEAGGDTYKGLRCGQSK